MITHPPTTFELSASSWASNPSATPGTSVTLGASNADAAGGVTGLITTPLPFACRRLKIHAGTNNLSAVDTSSLMDIVVDLAGGTSWDLTNRLIFSLPVGHLETEGAGAIGGRTWDFPIFIPSGATVGAIGRNVTGSDRTCLVTAAAYGRPRGPWWCGHRVDALGDVRASSGGTAITPNASANTYGSWTSVGAATARKYKKLIASWQGPASSSFTANGTQLQIGIGSNPIPGADFMYGLSTVEVCSAAHGDNGLIHAIIPTGTQLQARTRGSVTSTQAAQLVLHGVA